MEAIDVKYTRAFLTVDTVGLREKVFDMASILPPELALSQCQLLYEIREAFSTGEYDGELQALFPPGTANNIVLFKKNGQGSKTIPCSEEDYLALVKHGYIDNMGTLGRDGYRGRFHDKP